MSYVGWPTNVNKIILDSATVTVGDGAVVTDSIETGAKCKSRLSCYNPSDKFSVEMVFDWVTKDSDGLTEKDRFFNWYKYTLKYYVNSFYFPSILLNSNNSTGNETEQTSYGKDTSYEYYKIKDAVEGNKSGNGIKVKMTWITEQTGLIEIATKAFSIERVEAYNGYCDVIFNTSLDTSPTSSSFSLTLNSTSTAITKVYFDDDKTARVYFAEQSAGTYNLVLTTSQYYVTSSTSNKDTFVVS